MLLTAANLHRLQTEGLTIVDLLVASVLKNQAVEWPRFVVGGVSDVDEARTVYLIPSDMQLTLFEREVSKESLHSRLRSSIGTLLGNVRGVFDVVFIDCPPGLSILTESLVARGGLPLLADQARLRIDLRAGGLSPLQGPQPGDGICGEHRRLHQHEGRPFAGGCRLPSLAYRKSREPVLRPHSPSHECNSTCLAPERCRKILCREVSWRFGCVDQGHRRGVAGSAGRCQRAWCRARTRPNPARASRHQKSPTHSGARSFE